MTHDEADALVRTETFDCDGPADLVLSADSGPIDVRLDDSPHVRVTVAADRDEQRSGTDSGADDARLVRETKIAFTEERRRLVVHTPRQRGSRLSLHVEAPRGSRVTARTHRGSTTVSGETSRLNAATGAGDVTADRVEGRAEVVTGKGDVRLGRISGRLRARTGAGELEVGSLEGEGARLVTGHGDVWLGVVRGDVQARTGRGSVEVAEAGAGRVDVTTAAGDVRVAIRPGVAAELDLASRNGRAWSELEVADAPPANPPLLRIRAQTGAGDVVVGPLADA
jgi:hypothetical protein